MLGALGHSSADATYLARVLLIFIFAISSVIVVAGPKVTQAILIRKNPPLQGMRSRVRVSMISSQSIASCQMYSCDNLSRAMSRDSIFSCD